MSAFNGDRLKQARLYRGITITELAESIDVKKQSISQYEKGIMAPKADTMMGLIRELRFPKKYFYENNNDIKHGEIFYRSLMSTAKKDQYTVEQSISLVGRLYEFLSQYIDFPDVDLLERPEEAMDIEELTMKLRKSWNIGSEPIKSMLNLLEHKGVLATSFKASTEKIDAFSTTLYDSKNGIDRFLIVLGSDKTSAVRRNFNIAHELGHYYYDENNVDLSLVSREEYKGIESRAHEFAGAILLPKDAFINDIKYDPKSLSTYVNIKKKWNVSISAMVVRAYKLHVIDNNVYQNLMRYINRKGWRMEEPYDKEIPRCIPYVLPHSVELLIGEGVLTKHSFIQALSDNNISIPSYEVEYLLNLKEGTLTEDKTSNIVTLKLK